MRTNPTEGHERPSLRLKADTRAAHEAVEKVPFAARLAEGSVSRRAYARQLVAYGRVHAALERRTFGGSLPIVVRSHWAFDDASELGHGNRDLSGNAERVVAALEARILDEACFARLCGYVYVMEGSALGSAFMAPRLTSALHLQPSQVRYYRGLGTGTMQAWQQMRAALDEALAEPVAYATALEGALVCFRQVGSVLASIDDTVRSARTSSAPAASTGRPSADDPREDVGRLALV